MGISVNTRKNEKYKLACYFAVAAIIFIIFISLPALCSSHSDTNELPSFKYSREANENFDKKSAHAKTHSHEGHNHDHDHHHHDHDDHDHHHDHHDHDHDHHNGHGHHHGSTMKQTKIRLDMKEVWLHSIGSTLLISAAPYALLYIIPLDNSESMRPRLKVLLAFASGGLLGDAFLHLIPHATHPHTHNQEGGHHHHHEHHSDDDHSHGHDMTIGLWVLGGIIAFLFVEKLVRLIKGGSHDHNHGAQKKVKVDINATKDDKKKTEPNDDEKEGKTEDNVDITGYLNLAADFAHNFTDGLAIGASYLAGNSIGISTTIMILLHEVPHEIGDFAILIKSGCSRRKAMMLQLVTAFGALAGTALALIGASDDVASTWVLPFTAGGFIYIATVSVLPELLEESTKLAQSLKEITALLSGVGLMVLITFYE